MTNAFRDPLLSKPGAAGRNARGTTKRITPYNGRPVAGRPTLFLDSPGIGDSDITVIKLIGMLEAELTPSVTPPLSGIIVTHDITKASLSLPTAIVKVLVDKGFVQKGGAASAWQNVIFAGTKRDRSEDGEVERFKSFLVPEFFEHAPNKTGPHVCVSSKGEGEFPLGYAELVGTIAALPSTTCVQYKPPPAAELASALAETIGMTHDDFVRSLEEERRKTQALTEMGGRMVLALLCEVGYKPAISELSKIATGVAGTAAGAAAEIGKKQAIPLLISKGGQNALGAAAVGCLKGATSPVGLAASLAQTGMEAAGCNRAAAKTVGLVGNMGGGALALSFAGPCGVACGAAGGFVAWGLQELVGLAITAAFSGGNQQETSEDAEPDA